MTEVIIYTIDLITLITLIISIPILLIICEFLWYEVKDRWIKREFKIVHKMNMELEAYQKLRWDIEEDIEFAREDHHDKLKNENKELKKALLFFLDIANIGCSSNYAKDMENDCQKLFNCSHEEAKEKYGDFDSGWWESE